MEGGVIGSVSLLNPLLYSISFLVIMLVFCWLGDAADGGWGRGWKVRCWGCFEKGCFFNFISFPGG